MCPRVSAMDGSTPDLCVGFYKNTHRPSPPNRSSTYMMVLKPDISKLFAVLLTLSLVCLFAPHMNRGVGEGLRAIHHTVQSYFVDRVGKRGITRDVADHHYYLYLYMNEMNN